jgi:uncharacterized protein (UPF0332 family)
MEFNWQSFLDLAKKLKVLGDTSSGEMKEAAWRTAVSRAYYSVYNIAVEYLRRNGIDIPKEESPHRFVRLQYESSDNPIKQCIGENLGTLIWERVNADYKSRARFNNWKVEEVLRIAEETMEKLREIDAIKD